MRYMLLIHSPEDAWTPEQWQACVETSFGICQELAAKGQLLAAAPLHPVATATTVRATPDKPLVTTGPFAETAEQLGGFYLIDVDNLDQAIDIAQRLPPAEKGTVEIRPVRDVEGIPVEHLDRLQSDASGAAKFMFLCYDDEAMWESVGPAAWEEAFRRALVLTQKMVDAGRFISAAPLHPSKTATSVRIRNGKTSITDGPFLETREILGGYYIVTASQPTDLISLAAQHPGGCVEIRRIFDLPPAQSN